MENKEKEVEVISQLICNLTRNCNIKEDFFASSFNLSPTEVRVLRLFSFSDTYNIKELKEKLHITSGRITHVVSSLETKKLLARHQDENDKRNIIVSLLPKAAPLIDNLQLSYNNLHKKILQSVNKEELNTIIKSLTTLVNVFENWVIEK